MSSPDRRKQLKAKKERLQAKKHAQREAKGRGVQGQIITEATNAVQHAITSGRGRIAVATILKKRTLIAAMWEPEGVRIQEYNIFDEGSLLALATAAEKHVSVDEWAHFIDSHLKAVFDAGGDQYALSIVEWRPGEGPASHGSPTQS